MQDIYTSLQLKQNTLLYVYDGVISTAGIQNAKCLTVSQICISSKKVLVKPSLQTGPKIVLS